MAEYSAPTQDQVKEALRRITTLQLRRAFFERLLNPLWVKPLAKEGAFRNPPEPEMLSDGLIRDVYWPEIDYLTRAAVEVPTDVVDVLLTLRDSNNAWVRRGLFTIGAAIPAEQAARLRPVITSWTSTGFGWRTDPREMVSLAVNLLRGGQYEVGKWFAGVLFKPGKVQVLEEHWYADGLPKVVAVLGEDGLSIVLRWLEAYERSRGRLTLDSDLTFMSRDSLRAKSEFHESVEQALIDAVRDTAVKAMVSDSPSAVSLLLKSRMILARRIALFALSEALSEAANKAQLELMLESARHLLFDKSSFDDSCRIEYGELARAAASREPGILEPLRDVIGTALSYDEERLRQWMARDGANDAALEERVDDYKDRRMHRWLSAVGGANLPEALRLKLAELERRYGAIGQPLRHEPTVTSWSGPNSPVGQDEMLTMSSVELVAHLESWHAPAKGWGPEPSHEGQGRQLTTLLTTNPRALVGVARLVDRLRPTYMRAILQGWLAALRADAKPEWHQVAEVTNAVLAHSDDSAFPAEGDKFDDDPDYRMAKMAAVRLLAEIAQKRFSLEIPSDVMATLADMLVSLASDDTAWDEYSSAESGPGGMDPLTMSLNWQWPVRLRGLIYLMYGGKDAEWYDAARSALETELLRHDTRGASSAVLGEGLGRLLDTDPEWLMPKIRLWLGDEIGLSKSQQIALTTALAIHHYHPRLYDVLSPSMVGAISVGESLAEGWHSQSGPLQRIGEWVIDAVILGHRAVSDAAIKAFFTSAPPKVRGEALGRVAWALMHAESVEEEVLDRFAELWDQRVDHVRAERPDREELSGFSWFVKSGKFPVEWWLPRLKEALELDPEMAKERSLISEELARASASDPATAFAVLKLFLSGQDQDGWNIYDLARNTVPEVLAKAIASGDAELKAEAQGLMNELGAKGHLSLEAEVRALLAGGPSGSAGNN